MGRHGSVSSNRSEEMEAEFCAGFVQVSLARLARVVGTDASAGCLRFLRGGMVRVAGSLVDSWAALRPMMM